MYNHFLLSLMVKNYKKTKEHCIPWRMADGHRETDVHNIVAY